MIAMAEHLRESRRTSSPQAEGMVVGACLLSGAAVATCRDLFLTPADFATRNYAALFAAVLAVEESGQTPEPLTVSQYLATQSETTADDWYTLAAEVQDACPIADHVGQHVKIVKEYAQRRTLQATAHTLAEAATDQRIAIGDALDAAESMLYAARPTQQKGIQSIKAVMPEVIEGMRRKAASPDQVLGVPSAWPELNRLTFGWHPGQLIVIAARPSVGKTSFALQCAAAACMAGHRVLFESFEMSNSELGERLLAVHGRVPLMGVRAGQLSDDQWTRAMRAEKQIRGWRLGLHDVAGASIGEVRTTARRANPNGKDAIGLVIVDYLQLVSASADSRQNEVSAVSRGLKAMGKELGCPVIALSQLNRGVEQRGKDAEPQLSDLRESGAIEQDADVVIALHRPDKENPEALALLLKNRQGPVGRIPLQFRKSCAAFDVPQTLDEAIGL